MSGEEVEPVGNLQSSDDRSLECSELALGHSICVSKVKLNFTKYSDFLSQ